MRIVNNSLIISEYFEPLTVDIQVFWQPDDISTCRSSPGNPLPSPDAQTNTDTHRARTSASSKDTDFNRKHLFPSTVP